MSEGFVQTASPAAGAERKGRDRDLIAVVATFVRELHPQRACFIDID